MKKAFLIALGAASFVAACVMIVLQRRGPAPARPVEGIVSERPFDSMTRDELYEIARERDIPGRSRMKKDELRDVLRRA